MMNIMDKLYRIMNAIYRVILVNFIFLLGNVFFFQIYFVIDFKPLFFPIYLVVSLTFIPVTVALVRTCYQEYCIGSGGLIRSFWESLLKSIKKEKAFMLGVPVVIYLSLASLYFPVSLDWLGNLLVILNLTIIVLVLVGVINYFRLAPFAEGKGLVQLCIATYIQSLPINLGCLLLIIMGISAAFRVSFLSIVFVFGLMIYLLIFSIVVENKFRKKGDRSIED